MGVYTNRIAWEPLRSIDSATFTGSFQAVGTALAFPSYKCKLVNNSTSLVTISIDGSTAVDIAPAGSFFLYDESLMENLVPCLPAGTQIFVSGAAGTGLVYFVTQYLVRS